MALSWKEQLQTLLQEAHGAKKGNALYKKYENAFSHSYIDDCTPAMAVNDIEHIEQLSAANPLNVDFFLTPEKREYPLSLRLFQWDKPIPLSEVMPMLENMGLRADKEIPHLILFNDKSSAWISDFSVSFQDRTFEVDKIKELFRDAFISIYSGLAENDGFNKLILGASLTWREIVVLRAYTKYLRQIGFRFSQPYIEKTLINNAGISRCLVELFETLHNPAHQSKDKSKAKEIESNIQKALEKVSILDEDRIIRMFLELIKATLRTNYFQKTADGHFKTNFAFKLNSRVIPDLPLPMPLYEIFVYSPRFEAIHLRNTKVARGGIRWSDRLEDFRTEILGLMKAQVVKNAIIVPSGAKGGFVLKAVPMQAPREVVQLEVINCYQSFIRGLLDITDNIIDKKIVHPKCVVCYDDDDPYLVVAADKGTAAFSDIANSISAEYNFWLGDAFASGGSAGYDHKKMGITARGAWESIKRHFRELDVNVMNTTISVVGIGDMSGDVFGNGLIYSNHLKLIGAFDHRHIFIDPDPDPNLSYHERVRLFNLPVSSWEDYNPELISPGGGVFKRSLKSITLTPQMKEVLGVEDNALTPSDLIRAILKAPVDLLYNGGIGTYVKASGESNFEVGDRTNDYTRVDGKDLRCKVVGEGGNLGFTQLGRVEYALKGGLINTDFIDNSGGVDCSDHEVNLKILLDNEVKKGNLSHKKRNELLTSMTDEVSQLVLSDNYYQALVMSFSAFHSAKNIGLYQEYLKELETQKIINRAVEFLPDDKKINERKAAGLGLMRPELAVLLAYTKIYIKGEILKSDIPHDPYLSLIADTAFPASICKKYNHAIKEHRLHNEIVATQLSNHIVNEMGITFVYRSQMETGATADEVIRAYTVASTVFEASSLKASIESLDFKIPMHTQYEMLFNIRNLINLATRWFLHSPYLKGDLEKQIEHFSSRVKQLTDLIPDLMSGYTKEYLIHITDQFIKAGIPKELARRIGTYRAIYTALNIIDVATKHKLDLIKTAKVYFAAGERINLVWFRDQIAADTREGHWNALARLTLRDELDVSQRAVTVAIMKNDEKGMGVTQLIEKWMGDNQRALHRWQSLQDMLHASTTSDYTMFFIAMRELLGLILTSQ